MIRRQVAMALGRMSSEAAVPHLLVLARDKSSAVQEVAIDAVRRWEGKLDLKLAVGVRPPASKKTPKRRVIPASERG
jgi:HEAT repeat protein